MRERFERAPSFAQFVDGARKNQELWRTVHRLATVPPELVARANALPGCWHLLVLAEDWCGDAVNTVPVIQRLVESAPALDLRILARDENPDLMDAHLTGTSRSIPVVMLLDDRYEERGWWGPRPSALQAWVMSDGLAMDKDARYREIRRWYARDHGRSTADEIISLVERAAKGARLGNRE